MYEDERSRLYNFAAAVLADPTGCERYRMIAMPPGEFEVSLAYALAVHNLAKHKGQLDLMVNTHAIEAMKFAIANKADYDKAKKHKVIPLPLP